MTEPSAAASWLATRIWYTSIDTSPTVHGRIEELARAIEQIEREATERERERCAQIASKCCATDSAGLTSVKIRDAIRATPPQEPKP